MRKKGRRRSVWRHGKVRCEISGLRVGAPDQERSLDEVKPPGWFVFRSLLASCHPVPATLTTANDVCCSAWMKTLSPPQPRPREMRVKTWATKAGPKGARRPAATLGGGARKPHAEVVARLRARAGTWEGDLSGKNPLRQTRPR